MTPGSSMTPEVMPANMSRSGVITFRMLISDRFMVNKVPSCASVGRTSTASSKFVDLVVEAVEHGEEAVDQLVDHEVDQRDLGRHRRSTGAMFETGAGTVHRLAGTMVDGDDEMLGEEEVHLFGRTPGPWRHRRTTM